jgi:hypothetical protein
VVARFERQSVSHDAFCAAEDLNIGTFRTWLYKLRAEGTVTIPSFVEVVPRSEIARSGCVVRRGEIEVEFSERPAASYVGELLASLDSRPR